MKKILSLLLILLTLVSLTGCKQNTDVIDAENQNAETETSVETDYAVEKYHEDYQRGKFKEIQSMTELKSWIEPETDATGIILMSRDTCPYCQRLMPIVADLTRNENVTFYYANTTALKESADYDQELKFQEIVDLMPVELEKCGSTNDDGQPAIYVPLLIFIKNGEVIKCRLSVLDGYNDPNIELDNIQYMQVYDEIKSFVDIVYARNVVEEETNTVE